MANFKFFIVGLCAGLFATAAWAQSAGGEVDHSKMDHTAMGHGAPVTDGPWSYKSRKNPEPYKSGRWEMVPVPEYGHMFLSTEKLSPELRCAAVRDNPGVMVDRATRKACGMPAVPAAVAKSPQPTIDHKAMGH